MKYYYESNRISRYYNIYPEKPNEDEKLLMSLISHIEKNLNLATIQMERIIEDEKEIIYASDNLRPQSFGRSKPFIKYFSDATFYITTVNKYFNLIKKLNKTIIGKDIPPLLKLHEKTIKLYRMTRNSFEHIDERLIERDSFIKDVSSIADDALETRHGKINLVPESLTPLYAIFDEIIKILDSSVEPRKKGIDQFWREFDQRTKRAWDKKYGPSD